MIRLRKNISCAPIPDPTNEITTTGSQLRPSAPAAEKDVAYRCYLPVLTGFGSPNFAGLAPSTPLTGVEKSSPKPHIGIKPC